MTMMNEGLFMSLQAITILILIVGNMMLYRVFIYAIVIGNVPA